MKKLRWGILATGYIAGRFASGLKNSPSGELAAVSSRTLASAEKFAKTHSAKRAYGSHEALIADPEIDAIYIATPHTAHAEWTRKAALAGKHVLCEKPLAMNAAETDSILEAAKTSGAIVMEAFMYRCHPQTAKLVELIRNGELGKVKLVQASFSFHAPFDPNGRLFAKELGGGGILDVGCYPASFAGLVADAVSGAETVAGEVTDAIGELHPETGVDTWAIANLKFENGVAAQISCGTQLSQSSAARVYGDKAWVEIEQPWIVSRDGGEWGFNLFRDGAEAPERIAGFDERSIYGIEADHFADLVQKRPSKAPGMSLADTKRLSRMLEDWRRRIGVIYSCDTETVHTGRVITDLSKK